MKTRVPGRLTLVAGCLCMLAACRSAPLLEADPDPMYVIEIKDDTLLSRDPIRMQPNDRVIWLNSSESRTVRIEVLGEFPDQTAPVAHEEDFALSPDRAITRNVLRPGDVVTLAFPDPGVYVFAVTGLGERLRGRIIVGEPR